MPTRKPATETGAAAKRCLDAFYAQYVRMFNPPETAEPWLLDRGVEKARMVLPLIAPGKDAALMKRLVEGWDEATVGGVIDEFFRAFEEHDPRVERSNMDIGAFASLAQYVMLRRGRTQRPTQSANGVAARRATEKR